MPRQNDMRFYADAHLEVWVTMEELEDDPVVKKLRANPTMPLEDKIKAAKQRAVSLAWDKVSGLCSKNIDITHEITVNDINIDRIDWTALFNPEVDESLERVVDDLLEWGKWSAWGVRGKEYLCISDFKREEDFYRIANTDYVDAEIHTFETDGRYTPADKSVGLSSGVEDFEVTVNGEDITDLLTDSTLDELRNDWVRDYEKGNHER